MPRDDSFAERFGATGAWFTTTHWSVVWAARQSDSVESVEAWEKLCRAMPTSGTRGTASKKPRNLTQEFFRRLVEKNQLSILQHQDGKFRCFLKTLVKNFLSDERDKALALKCGGGRILISLDEFASEEGHSFELADGLTPEQVFERRWARTLMERALKRLQEEYTAAGKTDLFELLKDLQPGEHGPSSYAEVGKRFGLSEGGMKTPVHRFRRRHQEILREEISHTVNSAQELAEEIRHLIESFGR